VSQPFIKWYPTDWRADPRLRMCSLAARGLWIELIGYMHEGEPYGYLTINDVAPSIEDISALVGRPLGEVRKAMSELKTRQVYSVDALQGTPYSRRMVRDKAKADQDRRNGKGGGNPKLKETDKGGVNPPDKAQKPEARSQKPDSAEARERAPPRRAVRLPSDAVPNERNVADAARLGLNHFEIESQFRRMRDWSASSPKGACLDWDARWRNWCETYLTGRNGNGKNLNSDENLGFSGLAAKLRHSIAERKVPCPTAGEPDAEDTFARR
jgi:hypothetical protein